MSSSNFQPYQRPHRPLLLLPLLLLWKACVALGKWMVRARTLRTINAIVSKLVIVSMLLGLVGAYPDPTSLISASANSNAGAGGLPLPSQHLLKPASDPHLPNLSMSLQITPRIANIGDSITVTIKINNASADAANDLLITLPLPAGVSKLAGAAHPLKPSGSGGVGSPQQGSGSAAAGLPPASPTSTLTMTTTPATSPSATAPTSIPTPDTGWTWQVAQLTGYGSLTEAATMRVDSSPAGEAIIAHVQATADGLTIPAESTRGAVVMQPGRSPRIAHFNPGQELTLNSYDNHVRVTIPGDAAAIPLTITHSFDPQPGDIVPPDRAGFWGGFGTSYLIARDQNGAEVHQFSRPITITMDYTPQQLAALNLPPADLALFWFDPTRYGNSGGWSPVASSVDEANDTVSASVMHLSNWQLSDGSSPSDAFIPSLQAGQVDISRGSFTYSYPIDTPAGPRGIRPSLTLAYQSDESDTRKGERPKLQSSWAGKGWSLSPSYIALDKLDAYPMYSRFYTLVLNGQAFDIMRGPCRPDRSCTNSDGDQLNPTLWEWHSTDESFMKIRAEGNAQIPNRGGSKGGTAYPRYKWQIWTKDGTRYDFEEDAWQGWFAPDSCQPPLCDPNAYSYMETYKWYLTREEDTHGNRITYTYGDGTNGNGRTWAACDINAYNVHGVTDQDVWLTKISWGSNVNNAGEPDRYEVLFDSSGRSGIDTAGDVPDNMCGAPPAQTRQLNNITVLTNHSANPYNPNAWDQVRKYALTFQTDGVDQHYILSDQAIQSPGLLCGRGGPCNPDYTTKKLTLLSIQEAGLDNSTLPPTTFTYNYGPTRGTAYFPSGGWNRMASVDNGKGGRIELQYENIGAAVNGLLQDSDYRGNHRVTSKTEYSGYNQAWGHTPYVWTYNYNQSEAYNSRQGPHYSTPTSATVWFNLYYSGGGTQVQLAHRESREFRGHGHVTVHDPNGNETEHWFQQGQGGCTPPTTGDPFQNDCFANHLLPAEYLKGTEINSVSYQGAVGSSKLSEQVNSFTVATTMYPYWQYLGGAHTDDRKSGMWSSFHYMNQNIDRTWASSSIEKTTNYAYENAYGNLTSTSTTDNWAETQRHEYGYLACNNDPTNCPGGYLVRQAWDNLKDGSNHWLGRTVYSYDNDPSFGPGRLLYKGDLTLVRKFDFVMWPNPPGPGGLPTTMPIADTTYAYDTYGNRTNQSTYSGYGQIDNPETTPTYYNPLYPNNVARPTDTTYDNVYHDLPTQVQQPTVSSPTPHRLSDSYTYDPVLRVQTHSSDYNGQGTDAQYDAFSRLINLSKPGDTLSEPSVSASYGDYASPPTYTVRLKENIPGQTYTARIINQFYDGMARLIQTKSESNKDAQFNGTQNIVEDTVYDGLGQMTEQSQSRYVGQSGSAFYAYVQPSSTTCSDATERWTCTQYDGKGRTTQVTPPDGHQVTTSYSVAGGYVVASTIDQNLHKVDRANDLFDRLRQVVEYSGDGSYTPYAYTNYSYDPANTLVNTVDAKGKSTPINYDSLGRKTSMIDPTMGSWSYNYFVDGNLNYQTDNNLQQISFLYDEIGRLTRKTLPDGSYSSYTYDETTPSNGLGQRTRMDAYGPSPNHTLQSTVQWQYTPRGLQSSETDTVAGLLGNSRTTSWTYDSAERTRSITYPPANLNAAETVNYTYDAAWRETSVCSAAPPAGYGICYASVDSQYAPDPQGYTALGQSTQYTLGNNLRQLSAYSSPMQRISDIQVVSASNPYDIRYHFGYQYDNAGNLNWRNNYQASRTETIQYDFLNRLTQWVYPGDAIHSYDYDELGNIRHKDGVEYVYNYAAPSGGGGPYAVRSIGANNFTYDPNGNMQGGGGTTYNWTSENKPSSITAGGVTESYTYDADGQRLTKVSGGATTYYLGGGSGLYEEDGNGMARSFYNFNGQAVAQRQVDTDPNPIGTHDTGGQPSTGWACDASLYSQALGIDFWEGGWPGGTYVGSATANLNRPDVAGMCGNTTNHGFSFALPQTMCDNKAHVIYAYAIGIDSTGAADYHNPPLWNTPQTMKCAPGTSPGAGKGAGTGAPPNAQLAPTASPLPGSTKPNAPIRGGKGKSSPQLINNVLYIHRDHLGSVVLVTNSSGQSTGSQEYDPWGKVRTGGTVGTQTNRNFTGQKLDSTGLLDYNARVYDPGLSRFPSADSIVPHGSNALAVDFHDADIVATSGDGGPVISQALGRYSYVLNDPLRYGDPTGRAQVDNSGPSPSDFGTCDHSCQALLSSMPGVLHSGTSHLTPFAPLPPGGGIPPQPGITQCNGRVDFYNDAGLQVKVVASVFCSYKVGFIVVGMVGDLESTNQPVTPFAMTFACSPLNIPGIADCGEMGDTLLQRQDWYAPWPGLLVGTATFGVIDFRGQFIVGIPQQPFMGITVGFGPQGRLARRSSRRR